MHPSPDRAPRAMPRANTIRPDWATTNAEKYMRRFCRQTAARPPSKARAIPSHTSTAGYTLPAGSVESPRSPCRNSGLVRSRSIDAQNVLTAAIGASDSRPTRDAPASRAINTPPARARAGGSAAAGGGSAVGRPSRMIRTSQNE